MKKIVRNALVASTLLLAIEANAQVIGVRGGVNVASMRSTTEVIEGEELDDLGLKSSSVIGFHLGVSVELPVSDQFFIESGLLLSSRGQKETSDLNFLGVKIKTESTLKTYYLDIPVTANYRLPLGDNLKLVGTAGGYLGFGRSGTSSFEAEALGERESKFSKIEWGSDEDQMSSLDYGVSAGIGVEFNKFTIGAMYDLGLANLSNFEGATLKNSVVRFSLKYNLFGGE